MNFIVKISEKSVRNWVTKFRSSGLHHKFYVLKSALPNTKIRENFKWLQLWKYKRYSNSKAVSGKLVVLLFYMDCRKGRIYVFGPLIYPFPRVYWFQSLKGTFLALIFKLNFGLFWSSFWIFWIKNYETSLLSLCSGFIKFKICLSILDARTKTNGVHEPVRTRYVAKRLWDGALERPSTTMM